MSQGNQRIWHDLQATLADANRLESEAREASRKAGLFPGQSRPVQLAILRRQGIEDQVNAFLRDHPEVRRETH